MKHEIDLNKYQLRTDLMIESINNQDVPGIISNNYKKDDIQITDVIIDEEGGKQLNKKEGRYITIEFDDITDFNNKEKVLNVFKEEFNKILEYSNINSNDSCLVIGLGNEKSTPDSLGPITINNILVTKHLFDIGEVEEGFRNVSAIAPGVTGTTGIETSDLIKSIVNEVKPDFLIVIDALASQSLSRLNKTIQMSNTGIHPGSGIGNIRKEISKETVNVPVISIGVPTVVDAVTVVSDTIGFMHKHYAFNKKFINTPISKIVSPSKINYLKKSLEIDNGDKSYLLGMIGSLSDSEIRQLIFEVLTPIGYNLMVTPKEVDFLIVKLGEIISSGINKTLHEKVN